jgi:hypothetical protein
MLSNHRRSWSTGDMQQPLLRRERLFIERFNNTLRICASACEPAATRLIDLNACAVM